MNYWSQILFVAYILLTTIAFQREFNQAQRLLKEIRQLLWDLKARG